MRRARGLTAAALGLLALGGSGCGLIGGAIGGALGGGPEAAYGAHVLFLLRPGCPTVVARTLAAGEARAFTLLTLRAPEYAPAIGDVLEGPTRPGQSVFTFYPPEAHDSRVGGLPVPAELIGAGLDPGAARAGLDAACGPPPAAGAGGARGG